MVNFENVNIANIENMLADVLKVYKLTDVEDYESLSNADAMAVDDLTQACDELAGLEPILHKLSSGFGSFESLTVKELLLLNKFMLTSYAESQAASMEG